MLFAASPREAVWAQDGGAKKIERIFEKVRTKRAEPFKRMSTGGGIIRRPVGFGATDAARSDEIERAVGVTLFRLRRGVPDEPTGTKAVHHPHVDGLVAERIPLDTPLGDGEKVRLTIEVPREGFLYVAYREQFADGTFGSPILVFPTTRLNDGDNFVGPGKVVGLPNEGDNPPYFVLRKSRDDVVADVLSILVTDQPIDGFTALKSAQLLPRDVFGDWQRAELGTERLELEPAAGLYTTAEKEAEGVGPKRLERGDPLPQVVYVNAAKFGNAVMVSVPLRYR